jgi:hypothetical protein
MGNITMPEVEQATHLGIIKTTTMKHNIQTNVDENITKARRSAYSLFGYGFHLFFGCNSYPSRFAKSRAMLTMICASLS